MPVDAASLHAASPAGIADLFALVVAMASEIRDGPPTRSERRDATWRQRCCAYLGGVVDVVPRVDHYSQTKNLLVSFGQQPLDFF